MKKILSCIVIFLILFTLRVGRISAATSEAGQSAMPKFRVVKEQVFDYRVYTLRKFLSQLGSPLTPYSPDFIKTADYYGIDWRIVPAISGVESTFGKQIPIRSFNAYGWVNGAYSFKSWPESISVVTKTLKENYINKGAISIAKIAKIYAPPSTTWGSKVQYFVQKINPLPLPFDI